MRHYLEVIVGLADTAFLSRIGRMDTDGINQMAKILCEDLPVVKCRGNGFDINSLKNLHALW
jgi:hypothetical protein